jgi:predicted DNA-binding transcriptional regulator AlpA
VSVRDIANTRETADYMDKPEKTLINWRSLGIGPRYLKLGNTVRYRRSDVDAWLVRRAVTPRHDVA